MDAPELKQRKLWVHAMTSGGAAALAAAIRSVGIPAEVMPEPTARTIELGRKHSSGDECYPQHVTLGDMLRVTEAPGFDPATTAFFLPSANGPCRYGQYAPLLRKTLDDLGFAEVPIFSPTSVDLQLTAWRSIVSADLLRKMLLRTRPYEAIPGAAEEVYRSGNASLCAALEQQEVTHQRRMADVQAALVGARDRFRAISLRFDPGRPLIGVVGEIFCRLNRFSNEDFLRRIEKAGGECWLSDVTEWIWYADHNNLHRLRHYGKRYSAAMAQAKFKEWVQHREEQALVAIFSEDLAGYEEPKDTEALLQLGEPYLPHGGVLGEMVLSVSKAIYLHGKGADGIVDISPFGCMNGTVFDAIHPKISRDHDGIPIRSFSFDGTQTDVDRDIAIFMDLARDYNRRKTIRRVYPSKLMAAAGNGSAVTALR